MKALATILAISLLGCSAVQTITPTRVRSHTSSFDASTPAEYADKTNSGVLAFLRDSHGNVTHAVVTTHFLIYVQELLNDYGDQLTPPLVPGKENPPGVTPHRAYRDHPTWKVDAEHFDKYRQLARWQKSNREKTGTFTKLLNKI